MNPRGRGMLTIPMWRWYDNRGVDIHVHARWGMLLFLDILHCMPPESCGRMYDKYVHLSHVGYKTPALIESGFNSFLLLCLLLEIELLIHHAAGNEVISITNTNITDSSDACLFIYRNIRIQHKVQQKLTQQEC